MSFLTALILALLRSGPILPHHARQANLSASTSLSRVGAKIRLTHGPSKTYASARGQFSATR